MANTLYDNARKLFLEASVNWLSDSFKCLLVDTASYTPSFTTHQYLSDVAEAARIGSTTGIALTGPATTGGAADANDVRFPSVSGPSIEAIIIYKDTGTAGTSPLIAYMDTATGLPITPNGGDIIITWDNGTNKIFRL